MRHRTGKAGGINENVTAAELLADRSLSRLLGEDWPRTLDELETLKKR